MYPARISATLQGPKLDFRSGIEKSSETLSGREMFARMYLGDRVRATLVVAPGPCFVDFIDALLIQV